MKWKVYCYFRSQLIGVLKVTEDYQIEDEPIFLTVWGMKHLFGTNRARLMFWFKDYKYTDENKHTVHIEVAVDEGVENK